MFIANIEYGYDFERTAIDFTPGRPLSGPQTLTVAADRGWQNSGVKLTADETYRLTASGHFQVDDEPRLVVHRSHKNVSGQLTDDLAGKTLLGVSTLAPELKDITGILDGTYLVVAQAFNDRNGHQANTHREQRAS